MQDQHYKLPSVRAASTYINSPHVYSHRLDSGRLNAVIITMQIPSVFVRLSVAAIFCFTASIAAPDSRFRAPDTADEVVNALEKLGLGLTKGLPELAISSTKAQCIASVSAI